MKRSRTLLYFVFLSAHAYFFAWASRQYHPDHNTEAGIACLEPACKKVVLDKIQKKEIAHAELRKLQELLKPLIGLHIGDCRQPTGRSIENSQLLIGLRYLQEKIKNNKDIQKAFASVNAINRQRISADEKIVDGTSKNSKIPLPKLRGNYTAKDVLAADVCTRTCVAEMGGQVVPKGEPVERDSYIPIKDYKDMCRYDQLSGTFSPIYQMAVVANISNRKRKTFSESNGNRQTPMGENPYGNFAYKTDDPIIQDPYINVMLRQNPAQYSNWSMKPGAGLNHSRSLCPPNASGENLIPNSDGPQTGKFFAGGRHPLQKIQDLDRLSFENCSKQCTEMIFNPETFWEKTRDFDKVFYASPENFNSTDRAQDFTSTTGEYSPQCPATYKNSRGRKVPDLTRCMSGMERSKKITTINEKPLDRLRCMTFANEDEIHERKPWVDL